MQADPTAPTSFNVHVAPLADGGTEVAVYGELDMVTSPRVREAVDTASETDGAVVIDLRACEFVDSTGIGMLAGIASRLREADRRLVLRGMKPRVLRTFQIAGLADAASITIEPAGA